MTHWHSGLGLRDGAYPITWLSSIFASSVLYASAGLLWNLEVVEKRGAYTPSARSRDQRK